MPDFNDSHWPERKGNGKGKGLVYVTQKKLLDGESEREMWKERKDNCVVNPRLGKVAMKALKYANEESSMNLFV